MKKIILIIFTIMLSYNAFPQIQNEKVSARNLPKKVSQTPKRPIQIKFPRKEAVLKELEENLKEKDMESKGVAFARFLPFEVDFKDLEKVCDNNYCYKEFEVESKGANTLGFHFAKLELVEKAKLYIINDKEQYVQGPLTKETVNFSRNFLSGLLPGEKARFLLIEPKEHAGKSNINIDQISHGILDFYGVHNHQFSNLDQSQNWGFEFSAPCNQNIKCQQHLTVESRAVALIIKKTIDENGKENISLAGTGSLINNGKQNSLPIMLLAAHIYNDYEYYENDYAQFIFHYKSPQCFPNTEGPMTIYVQGAIPLGPGIGSTDLKLIQLKSNPNHIYPNNPVSFLGWSIIDEYKPFIENIHHPLGDVQKYAKGTSPQFLDYSIGGFNYHYWEYDLTAGIYESGSSGSPTFDHNKRVIGALTSKSGATPPFSCSGPNLGARSGRLNMSWSAFRPYLDPDNEGIVALNTITNQPGPKIISQISGPNQLCSQNSYVLENSPLDTPITWEVVSGANLLSSPSSGQGKVASLTPSSQFVSGQAKIKFTIGYSSGNKIFEKTFWVGRPAVPGPISGNIYPSVGSYETYLIANPPAGAASMTWVLPYCNNCSTPWNIYSGHTLSQMVAIVGDPAGYVQAMGNNACGNGPASLLYVTPTGGPCNPCPFIYPNPTADELMLEWHYDDEPFAFGESESYEVQLYDIYGKMLLSGKSSSLRYQMDLRKLKNGLYYLHILNKDGLIRRQIKVER